MNDNIFKKVSDLTTDYLFNLNNLLAENESQAQALVLIYDNNKVAAFRISCLACAAEFALMYAKVNSEAIHEVDKEENRKVH